MGAREQMYAFVAGLFALITNANGIWAIAGPLVLLGVIIRFVRWSHSTARGESDIGELRDEASEHTMGLHNRISYGRSYQQLRRQGFSESELRSVRRERSGSRFRR